MPRPDIDTYWSAMVPLVAARATCPRRAVGAILTDIDGRLVSTGYNGNAPGAAHCIDEPCPGSPVLGGGRSACEAVHAEMNALLQATGSLRRGHTLYCSLTPCFPCAKAMLTVGVERVVALKRYMHDDSGPMFLEKHGVKVTVISEMEKA